jgi:ADP-heptose:LPS heptosyltransferase
MTRTFIVSRTDRAGDLILTLPVLRELKKAFPQARIIAHVRKYTSSLLRLCKYSDKVLIDDNYANFLVLAKEFKALDPERIIVVHPSPRVIAAARLAGISRRTGRASNIWQFLLNDRRVQKRSKNQKHEYEYNLNLLEGIVDNPDFSPIKLRPENSDLQKAKKLLEQTGLKSPVVIHPGHGGSAFNLAIEQYLEITQYLVKHHIPTLISLGPGEEQLESKFAKLTGKNCVCLKNVPDFAILAAVFSQCSAFAGGSTGPMHLASALDVPVVAFFPPVFAMTPGRWGPTGHTKLIIKPEITDCNGNCKSCSAKGCMQTINLERACRWLTNIYYESSITD